MQIDGMTGGLVVGGEMPLPRNLGRGHLDLGSIFTCLESLGRTSEMRCTDPQVIVIAGSEVRRGIGETGKGCALQDEAVDSGSRQRPGDALQSDRSLCVEHGGFTKKRRIEIRGVTFNAANVSKEDAMSIRVRDTTD